MYKVHISFLLVSQKGDNTCAFLHVSVENVSKRIFYRINAKMSLLKRLLEIGHFDAFELEEEAS